MIGYLEPIRMQQLGSLRWPDSDFVRSFPIATVISSIRLLLVVLIVFQISCRPWFIYHFRILFERHLGVINSSFLNLVSFETPAFLFACTWFYLGNNSLWKHGALQWPQYEERRPNVSSGELERDIGFLSVNIGYARNKNTFQGWNVRFFIQYFPNFIMLSFFYCFWLK